MSRVKNNCIVSVVIGQKYKKFAEIFLKSYEEKTEDHNRFDVILVVDRKDDFFIPEKNWLNVIVIDQEKIKHINPDKTFGTGTVRRFDYSLKRYGYQFAIDKGYTNICFIDMDMTIRKWDLSIFNNCNKPGLWAGRGYPSSGFGTKPVQLKEDVRFTPKLASLKKELKYETDWVKYRMPFEAVMFLTDIPKDRIQKFIQCWEYVSDATRKLNLPMNKVTHEIGLAADMCEIPVYYNNELLSKVFKHYIMNHDTLLGMYNDNK